jgi:transcriptional regulator with XRE-family HTH domain
MGTKQRPRPKRLAEKLLKIRETLGVSQDELIDRLGLKATMFRSTISQYERGEREPSYLTLLSYSNLAGVCCDYLIDDSLDLPDKLPCQPKHKR